MLKSVDLALLPALQALLDEANITRAAARLGISQPSLSAKLTRLRELIGDPLLVPTGHGRGMTLTPRAQQLRPKLEDALAAATAALSRAGAFDPTTSEATVRILANDNAAALTLTVVLAALAQGKAGGLRIALLRPDHRSSAERLESGEADLAIGIAGPVPDGGHLKLRAVLEDGFATIQRKGHPRGTAPFTLDEFCAAGHLLVSPGASGFVGVVDEALAKLGRKRRVVLSVHGYALAPLVIARTDLITTLPRRLVEHFDQGVDLFDPPLALGSFSPALLWHERTHDDPANRWVRERIFAARDEA